MKAKKPAKSYGKPFLIGAAIFTVLILHFAVSQFIALDAENDSSVSELIERQPLKIEAAVENKSSENAVEAAKKDDVLPVERSEPEIKSAPAVERETATRKKQPASRKPSDCGERKGF